ncbi:hemin ABC transporter permease [Fulvitalea axinellae]|uniref:Hemin ABC transporter permease n=1 Tax=Fulvitalea axinellae TaxID=1182444 RepID=A0AAU9DC77_9BACT|nr:hemin ABC transporter permease [Fulvitalea axinellae]
MYTQIQKNSTIVIGLMAAATVLATASLSVGAVDIPLSDALSILLNKIGNHPLSESAERYAVVLLDIRVPRVLLAAIVGASLGVSGAALQGLFRNPLVEPGLIGVSSGAALAAVVVIVFGASLPPFWAEIAGTYLLPLFAFGGGLAVTLAAYRFGKQNGQTNIALLILSGIAFNALAGALIGLVIYHADDEALRNYTFWSMGDLSGASGKRLLLCLPFIVAPSLVILRSRKALNAIALGEKEAYHLGVNVERVKRTVIVCAAMAVGASVALTGMIGFVGLVVPHIIRTAFGPDHKIVLPASLPGGALLLIGADMAARTVVSPAELPIGIVTSLLGAPFFIYLLMKTKKKTSLN